MVKSRDGRSKDLLMPNYQASVIGVNRSCNTITLTPAPPSNSLVGAQNIYQYLLQPGTVTEKFDIIRLTMQVQNTSGASSVVISPPNMTLLRYEIYNGNNELMCSSYGESIMVD